MACVRVEHFKRKRLLNAAPLASLTAGLSRYTSREACSIPVCAEVDVATKTVALHQILLRGVLSARSERRGHTQGYGWGKNTSHTIL